MNQHEKWMRVALEEAAKAYAERELPIGGALVGGDALILTAQTAVRRRGSMVAHGELTALLDSKEQVYTCARPLTIYTTLEPCLMCLGAMMQCEVDVLVFGMKCAPDGATQFAESLRTLGQKVPQIVGGVLEDECVAAFRKWDLGESHPAYSYVRAILSAY